MTDNSESADIIQKYYRLCSVGIRQKVHIIDQVKNELTGIINKKELESYFRIQDGVFIPNEIVIGGKDTSDKSHMQINSRISGEASCTIIY